ncbi:RNA polymerase sigma factor SigJ [Bacillus horti]|uniref:RNA polymerase sigma-70 factor (ECF subfamily) n=1 Tax=Caldalkalibacillus horti TaxID=77523 RepID=A0ABT9VXS6_9BACI|nr:RNA polymerase sigma factor SigJ [Bacillus horti]MDQ0165803.1 RNA polymerase sigma-70 factor (ECF subfamily) [Bacillus horti]
MQESIYVEYKSFLLSMAYRLLGSKTDAEDIVHEVMIRIRDTDLTQISNLKSYLTRSVTNSCLNYLKSAKIRREQYTGPWLPEPNVSYIHKAKEDPKDILVHREEISYALLVSMEQLDPVERAVFILREAFSYEYKEIANLLNKSEASCRQILSRSKRKLKVDQMDEFVSFDEEDHFIQTFLDGSKIGNFDEFIRLLTDQATLTTDGGGKVRAALRPIVGRKRILALFNGISSKGIFEGGVESVRINGNRGVILTMESSVSMVICFKVNIERMIEHIYVISNPDKLKHL